MVVLELDDSLSVVVSATPSQSCSYTVVYDGEELAQYETSADPRTVGGRISIRNVVSKHAPNYYDKEAVGEQLKAAISEHGAELTEALGPR